MFRSRSISLSLMAVLLSACGGDEGPSAPQAPESVVVTGIWLGSMVTSFGGDRTLSMTLQETSNNVSGSYAIATPGSDPYWTGTVTGERNGMDLLLTLPGNSVVGDSPGTIDLSGVIRDADTIDGLLNGSGWVDAPVVLKRQ